MTLPYGINVNSPINCNLNCKRDYCKTSGLQ